MNTKPVEVVEVVEVVTIGGRKLYVKKCEEWVCNRLYTESGDLLILKGSQKGTPNLSTYWSSFRTSLLTPEMRLRLCMDAELVRLVYHTYFNTDVRSPTCSCCNLLCCCMRDNSEIEAYLRTIVLDANPLMLYLTNYLEISCVKLGKRFRIEPNFDLKCESLIIDENEWYTS